MPKHVDILSRTEVFRKFIFRIEEIVFRYETYAGPMSADTTRLNLDRGDSVAAVVHEVNQNTLIFTEQFRLSTYDKGPGWLLELPAGILEAGEAPDRAMRRELEEEIGYRVASLQHISTFYLSPGGISERIFLFYARVSTTQRVSVGGGLAAEGENIRVVTLPLQEALHRLQSGRILDAKTIIGLQWLKLQ
jgi:nudix-type nucleoside diphosphatase (YffH/AdpP family)